MARAKPVAAEERQTIPIRYRIVPYFAVEVAELPGIRGIGPTPETALANIRAEVRRRFPIERYDIEEFITNEEHA